MHGETNLILAIAAVSTAAVAAFTDYRTGRIPNALTLNSLALALFFRAYFGDAASLTAGIAGSLLTLLVPAGLFLLTRGRAIGGGDVKVLAALGAWLGPTLGLEVEFLSFLLLASYGFVLETRRGRLLSLIQRTFRLPLGGHASSLMPHESSELLELRFGPALGVGTFLLCTGEWFALPV